MKGKGNDIISEYRKYAYRTSGNCITDKKQHFKKQKILKYKSCTQRLVKGKQFKKDEGSAYVCYTYNHTHIFWRILKGRQHQNIDNLRKVISIIFN